MVHKMRQHIHRKGRDYAKTKITDRREKPDQQKSGRTAEKEPLFSKDACLSSAVKRIRYGQKCYHEDRDEQKICDRHRTESTLRSSRSYI